jgi:DNA-binding NtrC family response regulator
MQNKTRLPFVTAFYDDNRTKMKSIVQSTDKNDPLYKHYRAICVDFDPEATHKEKEQLLRAALDEPPTNIELFILLLWTACNLAVHSNRITDALRALELMKQLAKDGLEPELKVSIYRSERRIQHALDNYKEQLEPLSKALRIYRPGTRMWAFLKTDRIRSAIEYEDFSLAKTDLESLKPYGDMAVNSFSGSYSFLEGYYLYTCGKIQEALSVLKENNPKERKHIQRLRNSTKIQCLIKLDRLDEVAKLLDLERETAHDVWPPPPQIEAKFLKWEYETLRAYECLARKEFNLAREHAQTASTAASIRNPRFSRDSHRLTLWADLASGHSRAARVLLKMLDPEESKPAYAAEWARLHLIEGNRNLASAAFKKITSPGIPELVEDKLRFAFELSVSQTASLFVTPKIEITSGSANHLKEKKQDLDEEKLELIGESPAMRSVIEQIEKMALLKTSVLITGESGTGRKAVARTLHLKSQNSNHPFIPVNCGSASDTLIESELFGHIKGAFTGANRDRNGFFVEAGRGTIFLDEVNLLSLQVQARLLNVLENREVKPLGGTKSRSIQSRVIAATTESLEKTFRKDLFFLLNRVQIHLPPLRERLEDIPLLARHFLRKLYGKTDVVLGDDLIEALKKHSWPGNVRQLKEEIERIAIGAGNVPILTAAMFNPSSVEERKNDILITAQPLTLSPYLTQTQGKHSHYASHRLQTLRELFNQNEKLTQMDVIRLLNCAPKTAAKDLKTLMEEGWIRRVQTSAHLRTSFFVRTKR